MLLWPLDVKSQLTEKDPDAGKYWGQEEKGVTVDEMVGWHHRLNGHESEQTLEGQGNLVCCCSRGCRVTHNLATTGLLSPSVPFPAPLSPTSTSTPIFCFSPAPPTTYTTATHRPTIREPSSLQILSLTEGLMIVWNGQWCLCPQLTQFNPSSTKFIFPNRGVCLHHFPA